MHNIEKEEAAYESYGDKENENKNNRNKKTYRVMIGLTCLILLVLPLFFLVCGFFLPTQYEDTFLGELKYKRQRLAQTEGKRIILVGGSSVAFGTDSQLLKEYFPEYEIVNFGMYAALGTTVMLDLSMDELREGDVVILSPEQEEQTLSGYFDAEIMWQATDGDFSALLCLDKEKNRAMMGRFPAFAVEKFTYTVKGTAPEPEGVYSRDSFNAYGDVESGLCQQNIMPGGYDKNMPVLFEEAMVDQEFIEAVNDYTKEAKEKGATVWYRFCPMNQAAVEADQDIDGYYDFLLEKLDCQIIGNPHSCILEPEWFYDTNFHLNNSGKIVNTIQMIRDLKAQWRDSSKTEITMPEKPDTESSGTQTSDIENADQDSDQNQDGKYFVYDRQEDHLVVTGLTQEGEDQRELIIPSIYEEMPVTAIEQGAFAGAEKLESITIQENIETIGDGAFDGCSSLQNIVIQAKQPEECRPGQELLVGTDAWIVVDAEAESLYKTNYFWSIYGERIRSR